MEYKGYEISITPANIQRQNRNGQPVKCDGFVIRIFAGSSDVPIETFTAAVGYELLEFSIAEAEQFVMDYIETEKNELK